MSGCSGSSKSIETGSIHPTSARWTGRAFKCSRTYLSRHVLKISLILKPVIWSVVFTWFASTIGTRTLKST